MGSEVPFWHFCVPGWPREGAVPGCHCQQDPSLHGSALSAGLGMSKTNPEIPADPSLRFLCVQTKARQGRERQEPGVSGHTRLCRGGFNLAAARSPPLVRICTERSLLHPEPKAGLASPCKWIAMKSIQSWEGYSQGIKASGYEWVLWSLD